MEKRNFSSEDQKYLQRHLADALLNLCKKSYLLWFYPTMPYPTTLQHTTLFECPVPAPCTHPLKLCRASSSLAKGQPTETHLTEEGSQKEKVRIIYIRYAWKLLKLIQSETVWTSCCPIAYCLLHFSTIICWLLCLIFTDKLDHKIVILFEFYTTYRLSKDAGL